MTPLCQLQSLCLPSYIANHRPSRHSGHLSSLLSVLATTINNHLIISTSHMPVTTKDCHYSHCHQLMIAISQISSHHPNPMLIMTSIPITESIGWLHHYQPYLHCPLGHPLLHQHHTLPSSLAFHLNSSISKLRYTVPRKSLGSKLLLKLVKVKR